MPTQNPPSTHISESPRFFWLWASIILILFLIFRLPGIGVPLASDELAMVSLWAQMPYEKIISNYQYPNNHIFLTLVPSFLLKIFGLKEWLLRLPLLVCGLATLFLGYKLGKKISGNAVVGISTALLMAISEQHIYFSTNARGYIVTLMLALIAVIFLLNQLEDWPLNLFKGLNGVLVFLGWLTIWVLGTWTIPTFLFFEVSVGIFIAGLMLAGGRLAQFQKWSLPIAALAAGGFGFYLQYYMLIDAPMLAAATEMVSKTSLIDFFQVF